MKRIFILAVLLLSFAYGNAQSPQKMSFQAVIRNSSNSLVSNLPIGLRVSILQGATTGAIVYSETQTANTNVNGLVTIQIGGGNVIQGDFSTIEWANGPYFIQTETDVNGGTNYTITSTTQLLSVPYALYAQTSGSSTPGPQGPAGAAGPQGIAGANGANGLSAYEIAVQNGYTGTESQWLSTAIVGPQGPAGQNGLSAYEIAVQNGYNGTESQWLSTAIVGPQGIAGANGIDGATGPQGIQGPQGIAGTNGTNGVDGALGPQGPAGQNGINGQDGLSAYQIWLNAGNTGTETQFLTSLQGAQGTQGVQGVQGVAGQTGPTGAIGATGPQGAQGIQGPAGFLPNGTSSGNTSYWNGTDWIVNSSNLYNNGSNIGIGTTVPSEKLHVTGNVMLSGSIKAQDSAQDITLIPGTTGNVDVSSKQIKNVANPTATKDAVNAEVVQSSTLIYGAATGAANAYEVALTPAPAAYQAGMMLTFKANVANTGAATLNINGLGAKTIKKLVTTDVAANDITLGQMVIVMYDGTNFQYFNPATTTSGALTPRDSNTLIYTTNGF